MSSNRIKIRAYSHPNTLQVQCKLKWEQGRKAWNCSIGGKLIVTKMRMENDIGNKRQCKPTKKNGAKVSSRIELALTTQ